MSKELYYCSNLGKNRENGEGLREECVGGENSWIYNSVSWQIIHFNNKILRKWNADWLTTMSLEPNIAAKIKRKIRSKKADRKYFECNCLINDTEFHPPSLLLHAIICYAFFLRYRGKFKKLKAWFPLALVFETNILRAFSTLQRDTKIPRI